MAAERGIAVAAHDDETLEHVEEAARLGMTISEFPTTLLAAEAARDRGMVTVMGAPNVVKGGSHSGNLSAIELARVGLLDVLARSEEHTSELQSLMRISSAVFCLNKIKYIASYTGETSTRQQNRHEQTTL